MVNGLYHGYNNMVQYTMGTIMGMIIYMVK